MLSASSARPALVRLAPVPTPAAMRSFSSSGRLARLANTNAHAHRPTAHSQPALWARAVYLARKPSGPAAPRNRTFWSSSSSSNNSSGSSSSSSSSSQEQQKQQESEPEDPQKIPLTQKVKYLFRKYGWTTLVVYLGLSAVDFGLCFLVIYSVGADRVRLAEDWVLEKLHWRRRSEDTKAGEGNRFQRAVEGLHDRHQERHARNVKGAEAHPTPAAADAIARGAPAGEVDQVEKEAGGGGQSKYGTIATTAVLAYAIHKTVFLPLRVGITVAITPRVVRTLQGWGWKVGMAAGAPPTAAAAGAAGSAAKSS
ncbi:hypothetical protein JCM8202_005919 [Rhodotorula sphaerocarpa]